jgi:hypothetical protein
MTDEKVQMVQSARSGYQNIAEGSEVSATSRKLEMNLTERLLDRQARDFEKGGGYLFPERDADAVEGAGYGGS